MALRDLEQTCRRIGETIGGACKPYGFTLLMFDFGGANEDRHMTYISNADRDDMLRAIDEFRRAVKSGIVQPPGHPEPGRA